MNDKGNTNQGTRRSAALRLLTGLCLLAVLTAVAGCQTVRHGYVSVSGGGRLYYEERGTKGEPVLLLHGHSLDRRMWDDQFAVFARHHRVVRPDFRGYGRSSDQSETFQMTHADDVLAVMDSLGMAKAHVVGLSMGAFVAGDLLAMHPERLLTCVLASGGIRNSPGPTEPMDTAESARRDREIAALKAKGTDVYKREWLEVLMASGGSARERMRQPLWQMVSEWSAWQPLHKEVRLFYGREAWQALRRCGSVSVPTLLVRGANDVRDAAQLPGEAAYLSNYRYVVVPDCGHMLNMDQPQAFNELVLGFIENPRK